MIQATPGIVEFSDETTNVRAAPASNFASALIDRAVPSPCHLRAVPPQLPQTERERSMSSSLIRMANDIAVFHTSFPQDEAAQMVSEHINKFWAPSLRRQLFELVQSDPGGREPEAGQLRQAQPGQARVA